MNTPPQVPRTAWFAVIAFAAALAGAVSIGGSNGPPLHLRYVLPMLALAVPALLLRRWPRVAVAMMLGAAVLLTFTARTWELGYLRDLRYLLFLGVDIAIAYVAVKRPQRTSVVLALVALSVQLGIVFVHPIWTYDPINLAVDAGLAILLALIIGGQLRERRARTEALRVQTAAQAVAAERSRIAREVHDMVAHSIGIIALQAGVGRRVIESQPDEARNALEIIEATSRETLAGLRRTLGTLRQADGSAALAPLPGLADLDQLAAATGAAGVRVEVVRLGQPRPLPSDIDLSAYRIVQEAVTNVVRHAGVRQCQVTVDFRDAELSVEVVDAGAGGTGPGTGYGIDGMRERAGLLGGTFTAGPVAGGGFRVAARLPLGAGLPVAVA